ncbi:hypothetical protein EYZ11_006935 [Aspergillus tanneri]|uniref:Uncharacterized protein n=1 Tax=Aspergillus tanneri TaxID=1220188 RepID=A0A4S3JEJ5_9EURO|nr:hypothetical protein EYZ11_006935 [Aspergillus tanneri]
MAQIKETTKEASKNPRGAYDTTGVKKPGAPPPPRTTSDIDGRLGI